MGIACHFSALPPASTGSGKAKRVGYAKLAELGIAPDQQEEDDDSDANEESNER